jgi:TolB-like protein/tetratricopeptide (TPR) repeat protein
MWGAMAQRVATAQARVADDAVQDQLARILASKTFQQVDRLKRFARFIVQETVAGRGAELKEYVIGVQVFGRPDAFDPRTDPIVRVQARRLRARLDRFYRDEGQADAVVIELPKGGYAPAFRAREVHLAPRASLGETLADRHTIAVRTFADCTPTGALTALCRSLTDDLVHELARQTRLRVVAPRVGHAATGEAARDEVGLVVDGSVRVVHGKVKVTTLLLDGVSGVVLWTAADEAALSDPFEVVPEVVSALVARVTPDAASGAALDSPVTDNLAARNLYLQGRYHLNQRTEDSLLKAAEFFERAIAEDAHYSLAYSGLADAHGLLAHYGVLGPADVWAKAASNAASAVMLDARSAEAHTSLAHVHATQDWDWAGAEREYLQSIRLNARYPTAHHWYAVSCLVPMGRLDAALEQIRLAQALDPVSSIISRDLALIHLYRRDFDSALDQCDHTIELNPHFAPAYLTLGLVREFQQDLDEAAAAVHRAVDLAPKSPRMQAALARINALSDRAGKAREALDALLAMSATRYVSPFDIATVYLALGDRTEGLAWLTRACDDRCFELLALAVDPRFDGLRRLPTFVAATAKVKVSPPDA